LIPVPDVDADGDAVDVNEACAKVCARGFLGFLIVYNDLRKSCSACSAGWNKGQTNSSAVLLGVIDLCSNNKNINN
jgi:hypothetical protein